MRIALIALTAFLFSNEGVAADQVYHCNMWNSVFVSSVDPRETGVIRDKPQKFKFSLINPYGDGYYKIEFFQGGYFDGLTLNVLKKSENNIHAINHLNTQIMKLSRDVFRFVQTNTTDGVRAISGSCERIL